MIAAAFHNRAVWSRDSHIAITHAAHTSQPPAQHSAQKRVARFPAEAEKRARDAKNTKEPVMMTIPTEAVAAPT